MFVLKNLILALATVLDWAIMIYIWIVIIRALISWVEPNPYNPIVRFLHAVTEPLLAPIRYYLLRGMPVGIDLSPMVLIFIVSAYSEILHPHADGAGDATAVMASYLEKAKESLKAARILFEGRVPQQLHESVLLCYVSNGDRCVGTARDSSPSGGEIWSCVGPRRDSARAGSPA
jgi:YggT family protein